MTAAVRVALILAFVVLCAPASALDRGSTPLQYKAATDRRVALVIGNGAYRHAPALPNPANDARDMAELLKGLGFEVMLGIDQHRHGMEEKFRAFSDLASDAAVALFYYAGHGMQVNGQNYLVPVDAALDSASALDFETVEVDRILRYMVGRNRIAIALLDACRDNPLSRRLTLARSGAVGRGLALPVTGGGLMIGFATAPGETASDGDGRNSPFATALLRHLGTPKIEINQAMRRVMADVSAMTGDRQRPWLHSDISADFYMSPQPGADMLASLPEPVQAEPPPAIEDGAPSLDRKSAAEVPLQRVVHNFAVFPNQKFSLCGFQDFSASIVSRGASGLVIGLTSRDARIPDRSFRGFETQLPIGETVTLWDDCEVTAMRSAVAGIDRISFSVSMEDEQ